MGCHQLSFTLTLRQILACRGAANFNIADHGSARQKRLRNTGLGGFFWGQGGVVDVVVLWKEDILCRFLSYLWCEAMTPPWHKPSRIRSSWFRWFFVFWRPFRRLPMMFRSRLEKFLVRLRQKVKINIFVNCFFTHISISLYLSLTFSSLPQHHNPFWSSG